MLFAETACAGQPAASCDVGKQGPQTLGDPLAHVRGRYVRYPYLVSCNEDKTSGTKLAACPKYFHFRVCKSTKMLPASSFSN